MKYGDYRRFGHGRIVAGTLCIHPALWYGGCAVLSIVVAFLLP